MVLTEVLDPAAGRVAFAVVLLVPILTLDRFGRQGDHLGEVRMDDDGTEHLVVVGDLPVGVLAGHAMVAVNLPGAEVFDAVEGNQVRAAKEDMVLQDLATLQLPEDVLEQGTKMIRVNLV